MLVGGPTAEEADTQTTVRGDALVIVPLTLAVVFAVLVLLLRAVVAPLYLAASQILSFAATLGIASLAFKYVFDSPGTDREPRDLRLHLHGRARNRLQHLPHDPDSRGDAPARFARRGSSSGLDRTGGVISSAGIILAGTFAVLMTLPLEVLFQLGFAVAVGLLIDTFVVRTLFVPSVGCCSGGHRGGRAGSPGPG